MSRTISVMLCVNNPDNGNYCGRCAGIHIDDFLDLDPRVLPEPRCTLNDGYFRIHRRRFPIHSHQSWVGNWCWDAVEMTHEDVAALVALCLSQRWKDDLEPVGISVWGIDCAHGDPAIRLADMDREQKPIRPFDVLDAWMNSLPPAAADAGRERGRHA